jgi:acid phosphatase
VTGLSAGQTVVLENATVRSELATIATVGAAGSGGTGVDLTGPLAKAHNSGGAFSVYTPDPTGDMTKVFGAGSPEWKEGRDSQIAPSNTAARAIAQTDFVGIAIHCAAGGGICNANAANARPDPLPDEQGGYSGYKALFGTKYVNPAIGGSTCVNDITATPGHPSPITDPFNQCGFPGFDGMYAKNTLGEVAQMQESGVPVTFGYISDAHDFHGVSGNTHVAYGPGEQGYHEQLAAYDEAFADFFARMQKDGITPDNSLFVVTVEEGDHFAGTAPDNPSCNGLPGNFCTYANGHVTEANGDLRRIIQKYNVDHGTNATTDFSVHADMAPNVYVKDNPARDSAKARDLEKAMLDVNVTNPLSNKQQKLLVAAADPVEEKLLHMQTADPLRTPTFTPFAQGDYFLSASSLSTPATPCNDSDPTPSNHCVFLPVTTPPAQTFAWNHGGIQPEVRSTWIGWVGPGIEKNHETDKVWTDHTDIRPTMLSLLGLKDSYVPDGRVVTEFLKGDAGAKSLKEHKGTLEELGALYKQINASFGQFSLNTLCASTGALASNTAGDTTYANTENALETLGSQRDTLANSIRAALWDAEFGGQSIDEHQAKDWIKQGHDYLDQASALCGSSQSRANAKKLEKINHVVVIYEENHSFDNLYGGWEGVNGLSHADAAHTKQVNQAGNVFACLKQDDVNLASPPLAVTCNDSTAGTPGGAFGSHFTNAPFNIDTYIGPNDVTCPKPTVFGPANGLPKNDPQALPGGCTRDLVHRFYQEPYQLDGGKQDRYVTGSDAIGLTMGYYNTTALPIYQYLHGKHHPKYAIDDDFFQGAFGGSYLNHQWLIAAATPVWTGALNDGSSDDLHSALDANGMPNNYMQYSSPLGTSVRDTQLTQSCNPAATRPPVQPAFVCGNYTVNTTQPFNEPFSPGTALTRRVPPFTGATIGDELSSAGVDWAWYSGGWDNAAGNTTGLGWTNGAGPDCSDPRVLPAANTNHTFPFCPDGLFMFHHQPFNYYANYAPGTPGRAHLQDQKNFEQLAKSSDTKTCNLKQVSFVKPLGSENEHPGYASEHAGSSALVDMLTMIEGSACKKDTMVVVTYDEFGGQWDHVPSPGQGNNNGPHDVWGPGTRVPTLIVSPHLKGKFVVDSTEHDTTSILSTIEHRWGLDPLGTRDAAVSDLTSVFSAKKPKHH